MTWLQQRGSSCATGEGPHEKNCQRMICCGTGPICFGQDGSNGSGQSPAPLLSVYWVGTPAVAVEAQTHFILRRFWTNCSPTFGRIGPMFSISSSATFLTTIGKENAFPNRRTNRPSRLP